MNKPLPSYKTIARRVSLLTFLANPVGALLTYLYLSVIDPEPIGQAAVQPLNTASTLMFIVFTALLVIFAGVATVRITRQISVWSARLQNGLTASEVPEAVRRLVLNYIPFNTLVTFVAWLMAGLIFGVILANGRSSLRTVIGVSGVGGVMTTALVYFVSDLLWQPAIQIFFPDGGVQATRALRVPVMTRFLIVFFLSGPYLMLLLAYLSIERAGELVSSSNPATVLNNLLILDSFLLIVGVLAGVGLTIFMGRGVVGPLKKLEAAMQRVEQNDLNAQVPITSADELGYVSEHFNQMTAGLRRGELLRNVLNLYVSPEVAREAVEHGTQLGGKMIECTVLFSDIRDFTGLSEKLPPADLIALLNRYMSAMVAVIIDHGGIVNKFGGDSLLAVFGTPLNPIGDHAASGVRAALAMQQALIEFNRQQAQLHSIELRIGIGIATGPVVAGNIGGQHRIEYTVIGDTVNLASRLQSLTKELGYKIMLSAATYATASSSMSLEAKLLPAVDVRGKSEPVVVYAI
jgi:adenylate cyclase